MRQLGENCKKINCAKQERETLNDFRREKIKETRCFEKGKGAHLPTPPPLKKKQDKKGNDRGIVFAHWRGNEKKKFSKDELNPTLMTMSAEKKWRSGFNMNQLQFLAISLR